MGTRLKPLTSTVPKPLAMLGNKPILFHILDRAYEQGVDEAVITLGYLGEKIEEALKNYKTGMNISFSYESAALGTAGAVKKAARDLKGDFLVLSGDSYSELDLKSFFEFHKSNLALASIACVRVDDPREYGLVITDSDGRIQSFLEKPGWPQAVTNLANTGIYALSRQAVEMIPENTAFDFSNNLFPMFINRNLPVFAYEENAYWCDIGEIGSYLRCNEYVLSGLKKSDDIPRGEFSVADCVYIGKNVTIGNNSSIGKYSVICDNASIGENTVVDGSVIYQGASVGSNCRVEKSVVCENSQIKDNSVLGSFCSVGANSTLGRNTVVYPSVRIADNVEICGGITVSGCVSESIKTDRISDVSNSFVPEADCFFALELGCALGTALKNAKIAVASDSAQKSKAVLHSLISGLSLTGAQVWSFGECFNSQVSFFTYFCSLELGLFVKTNGENVSISLTSAGGLPMRRETERKITSVLKTRDYSFASSGSVKHTVEMQNVMSMYSSVLFRQSESSLSKMRIRVESENEKIVTLLDECIKRLEGETGGDIILRISADGTNLSVTENNINYTEDKILSVLVYHETKIGRDVSVSFFSPPVLCALTSRHSGNVFNFYSSCADGSDEAARAIALSQLWTRDALFMAVRLLSLMHEEGKTLHELMKDIPEFYLSQGEAEIDFSPSGLNGLFSDMERLETCREGVTFLKNNARAVVVPETDGKKIKILAESFDAETARDLCGEIIEKIKSFDCPSGT